MKVLVEQKYFDICKKFAEDSYPTHKHHYAKRNQFNKEKIIEQITIGKLSEFTVYQSLKDKYIDITVPDTEVYVGRKKSFDFDMKATDLNLHIKGQLAESAKQYGQSWIFQWSGTGDGHCDKEIFYPKTPNQYVAFVLMSKNVADVQAIVSLDFLHKKELFKLPKLQYLHNTKRAVYWDDLKLFSKEELWQV